jgi:hypothetical protein
MVSKRDDKSIGVRGCLNFSGESLDFNGYLARLRGRFTKNSGTTLI